MADTVTSQALQEQETSLYYTVHLTNSSDGTGETNVVKIDKSALTGPDGTEPSSLSIMSVRWCMQGFTKVKLSWDHTADVTAMILSGNGYEDFTAYGGLPDTGTGETGDLLLTTTNTTSGNSYDITIKVRKVD